MAGMRALTPASSLFVTLSLLAPALAQGYDASPAPQLKKLQHLVGSWAGGGVMSEPTGQRGNWTMKSTYKWALGGHFLQEDFSWEVDGVEGAMVVRNYIGWDRERGRFVTAMINSQGRVGLHDVAVLPDGTLLTLQRHHQGGAPFQERARVRVEGDTLDLRVEMLMAEGNSLEVLGGELTRGGEGFAGDWGTAPWMGAPAGPGMAGLAKLAGTYETTGQMVMGPGMPETSITGTDRWQMVFGGTAMHGTTRGQAAGAPDAYESHALWGWDPHAQCLRTVYVDSMGQVGEMQCRWHEGMLVSTMHGTQMGTPTTQRYVIRVDEQGHAQSCKGHVMFGAGEPFLSFSANYARK